MKLYTRTHVFSDACSNCNLWWCLFLNFMVSNVFMATCHKCNQPNHNNLSSFPLPILENVFLRIVFLSPAIYLLVTKGVFFFIKTQLVASGELPIIFCFQTFNYNASYSQNRQSNICTSSTIVICSDDRLMLKTLALETFYNSQCT